MTDKLVRFAPYGAVVAVGLEWSAAALFYLIEPGYFGGTHPISVFGTLDSTRWIFVSFLAVAALCFWLFVQYALRVHYKTPTRVFGFSMICMGLMALYPFKFDGSVSGYIHLVLAAAFGISFFLGIYLFGRYQTGRLRTGSYLASGIALLFTLSFFIVGSGDELMLFTQVSAGLSMELWSLWVSWYALTNQR